MPPNRALGLGLVGLGAVLGGVMLLWLLVTLLGGQTSPGGAVLGLLLAAVLGLPPVGAGLYVLSRGKQEAAEAAQLGAQRRTLDADRLFRTELAREIGQLERRVRAGDSEAARLAERLRDVAQDLEAPGYDQAAWYEAVELGRADREALRRYDELLNDGLRAIGDLVDRLEGGEAVGPELRRAIVGFERNLRARSDLLLGRPAPAVAPAELLGAQPAAASGEAVAALKVGDAVSRDGADYLVEASVSYFVGGRTWWLHRLVAERDEAWLLVGPGGLSLAWLGVVELEREPGASEFEHEGASCRLEESFAAAAEVRTGSGSEAGGAVTVWRYACDNGRELWIERWPERRRAYGGGPIRPSDLEVWPAEAGAERGM